MRQPCSHGSGPVGCRSHAPLNAHREDHGFAMSASFVDARTLVLFVLDPSLPGAASSAEAVLTFYGHLRGAADIEIVLHGGDSATRVGLLALLSADEVTPLRTLVAALRAGERGSIDLADPMAVASFGGRLGLDREAIAVLCTSRSSLDRVTADEEFAASLGVVSGTELICSTGEVLVTLPRPESGAEQLITAYESVVTPGQVPPAPVDD